MCLQIGWTPEVSALSVIDYWKNVQSNISEQPYSQVPLWRGAVYHDSTYDTVVTVVESKSDFKITKDIPYLALTGELSGVYCDDFGEHWPR